MVWLLYGLDGGLSLLPLPGRVSMESLLLLKMS